jgi:PRTRC genetic system protein B
MQASIRIGQNCHYQLSEALLLYRAKQEPYSHQEDCFITHHAVAAGTGDGIPTLGPARPLTLDFVQSLVSSLGGHVAIEVLPDNVVARTDQLIAWWTPSQKRRMFFGDTQGEMRAISGEVFPQPALVWAVSGQMLAVRALKEDGRPTADTKVCVAPYWNLYENGHVCQGSMRSPNKASVKSIPQWEKSFYESEFTHGNVGRVTRYRGGFEALWKDLASQQIFPTDTLIELPQTLDKFLPGVR